MNVKTLVTHNVNLEGVDGINRFSWAVRDPIKQETWNQLDSVLWYGVVYGILDELELLEE